MEYKNEMQQGWEFAAAIAGTDYAINVGIEYIDAVKAAIEKLEYGINNHTYRGLGVRQFQGYVAEEWSAQTFNIDAVAAGSKDYARVLNSLEKGSVDVQLDSGGEYSMKSYANGTKSAVEQATFNVDAGEPLYRGQHRWVPMDQLQDAQAEAHRRVLHNRIIRPEIADSYAETKSKLTDVINNDEGIKSTPISRKELDEIALKGKQQDFNAKDADITLNNVISDEYILRQALKAGYTAASITIALQLAPEIYKTIDYLIKHGEINIPQIKKAGKKAFSSGTEGFIRGSVACSLLIKCKKGSLGAAFTNINPTLLGFAVTIIMQTVKDSVMVAAGKMTAQQMGMAFVDCTVAASGYLIGSKLGGAIGQVLGWELPVIGYLLGSLLGTSFAVVYGIGKKKLIGLCIDTGFTCFGLVEQNYELPDNVLKEMGISTIPIPKTPISRANIVTTNVATNTNRIEYETIDITILRRGVIGINKIGYIMG